MAEILTAGETMAVLIPKEDGGICYNREYRMRAAGAESNTAIGVCKLGHTAAFLSKVGADGPGEFILKTLRAEGVDSSYVGVEESFPTGLMFKEMGTRETRVTYYRAGSAASHLAPADIPKKALLESRILHLSGITPVLSKSCMEMTEALFAEAQKAGVTISFDPNIRKKLWKEKDFREQLTEWTLQADVALLGVDEAECLFGIREEAQIFDLLFSKGRVTAAVLKNGSRGAVVANHTEQISIEPYPCRVIDPVGAGDGFNAGFLCGILEEKSLELCGKMGGICGALATETTGDFEGYPTKRQMERLLLGEEEIYR